MSYRSQYNRVAYIHQRLRHKKDYPSTKTLAADYLEYSGEDFSKKTFSRDIEWLKDHNAPIEYDTSKKGFYYSNQTYTLPSILLSEQDILSLLIIEDALSSYSNSPFYSSLQKVFYEVKSNLPEKANIDSKELSEKFSIIPEPVTMINEDIWQNIQEGLKYNLKTKIHYKSPKFKNAISRVIHPYHLSRQKGEWYLLCHSEKDDALRTYALTRMINCKVLSERFQIPSGFKHTDHIDPSFGVFTNEEMHNITIKFYAPIASLIKERRWHPEQKIEDLDDGSILLRFKSNQIQQTLYWISQWGPRAEIIEPESLRKKAAQWFSDTSRLYFKKIKS